MQFIHRNIRINLFLFFLTFLFSNSNSQVYYKIPTDTNHFWRQFSICVFNNSSVNRLDYQIRYYKDTIVNGQSYNKYGTFGRSYGTSCASFIKNGFLRQDTINKAVYILDNNFQERPLYNFSKSVGDTLQHYNKPLNANITLTVVALDTAYLDDGTQHNAWWVSNNNCFIEGVGSLFGGLYGNDQLLNTPNNVTEQLMCFGRINPFYKTMDGISQTLYYCSFVSETVGINKNLETLSVKIFPNPAKEKINIEFEQISSIDKINITNTLGQELYTLLKPQPKQEIDISFLPAGIYFLKAENRQTQGVFKLIKEY